MITDAFYNTRELVEKAIVGCLLQDFDATMRFLVGSGIDGPNSFSNDFAKTILETALALSERKKPIDSTTVYTEISKRGLFARRHSELATYISAAIDFAPTVHIADYLAGTLRSMIAHDKLKTEIGKISQEIDATTDAVSVAKDAANRFEAIAIDCAEREETIVDAVRAKDDALRKLDEYKDRSKVRRISFGIDELDRIVHVHSRTLVTIAARPSQGKTALACQVALKAAAAGTPVLFVTLEMPACDLVQRMLAHLSGVPLNAIRYGMVPEQLGNFNAASDNFEFLPIRFIERGSYTTEQLAVDVEREVEMHGAQLLVLDYVQLMRPTRKCDRREQEVAEVYSTLCRIKGDNNIAVVALAQLNRDVEKSERKPRMSDIRESGAAENDSDVVMFIHKHAKEKDAEDAPVTLVVGKNRNGATGDIECVFHRPIFTFSSKIT